MDFKSTAVVGETMAKIQFGIDMYLPDYTSAKCRRTATMTK